MEKNTKILSDITVFSKYAKYLPSENRRETWEEIVYRNLQMHLNKYPQLEIDLFDAYRLVLDKKVLPSMRSAQFSGKPTELNNARIFNCSYLPIDSWESFHELMFLLMSGCGVGYSVQQHDINNLPPMIGTNGKYKKYIVGDSLIGWADSVKVLIKAYTQNKPMPRFDFSEIRPKGTPLKTSGGVAPGAGPLKDALHNVQRVIDNAIEERGLKCQLKPIEVHDICCHLADAVLAGGVRRSALISLFSYDDKEMLECKFGNWWETNPQRGRANNSVVMVRNKAKKKHFDFLWERIKASGSGEPGIIWTNNKKMGVNPCVEISLKPYQFCNLTTVNVGNVESQEDLNERVKVASLIGTLQASYTDFHYLRDIWKETTEQDALLGISMTGICSGEIEKYDLEEAAKISVEENKRVAKIIGINPASRVTTIKPEGTSSLVLGTSSGIHAWYADYYIRRLRFGKDEPIYNYLKHAIPNLVEDDFFKPETQAVVSIPIEAPENAIKRGEPALSLLNRVKHFYSKWLLNGHIKGDNTNNVSVTVSIKDDEWESVGQWMWDNKDYYNGISVLPYDSGSYVQAPFEEISKDEYKSLIEHIRNIDLKKVKEHKDTTDLKGEVACAGGKCEI